jgi:hypothetical protein
MFQPDGPWLSRPQSVLLMLQQLSEGLKKPLSDEQGVAILWRLVDQRECPICSAGPGLLCYVFGGFPHILRTHPIRLVLTDTERTALICWVRDRPDEIVGGEQ